MITKQKAKTRYEVKNPTTPPEGVELAVETLLRIDAVCESCRNLKVSFKACTWKDFKKTMESYGFAPKIIAESVPVDVSRIKPMVGIEYVDTYVNNEKRFFETIQDPNRMLVCTLWW